MGVALCFKVRCCHPNLFFAMIFSSASDCPFLSDGLSLSSKGGLTFFSMFLYGVNFKVHLLPVFILFPNPGIFIVSQQPFQVLLSVVHLDCFCAQY